MKVLPPTRLKAFDQVGVFSYGFLLGFMAVAIFDGLTKYALFPGEGTPAGLVIAAVLGGLVVGYAALIFAGVVSRRVRACRSPSS